MSDEPAYELVVPFVTCTSRGGPHDDESFTRGWEMGKLYTQLESLPGIVSFGQVLIHRDSRPMADLILAHHHWHMHDVVGEGTEWHWCDIGRDDPNEPVPDA